MPQVITASHELIYPTHAERREAGRVPTPRTPRFQRDRSPESRQTAQLRQQVRELKAVQS